MNSRCYKCLPILFIVFILAWSCTVDQVTRREVHLPEGVLVDTIPFVFDQNGHIIVKVKILGKDYDFLFDSGAQRTIIRQGIPVEPINTDTMVISDIFSERYHATAVTLEELGIGQLTVTGLNYVLQTKMSEDGEDGILGGDVLRNMAWKIDFSRRKIYAAKRVSDLGIIDNHEGIRFILTNNMPSLTYRINGTDIEAMMDTGHNGCIFIKSEQLTKHRRAFSDRAIFWHKLPSKQNTFEAYMDQSRPETVIDTMSYIEGHVEIGNHALHHEVIEFVPDVHPTIFGLDLL